MSQWWYYDFMNLNSALGQALHKEGYIGGLHYVKDIASTKVSEFKYKNIEKIPGLTSEILETMMLFNYQLCFYKSPALGWILCRYIYANTLSYYLKPTTVNLIAFNGQSIANNVPYEDIILVKDNSMDILPFICMMEYVRKMDRIDTSVFRTLEVASLPLAIVGNKKVANQLKAIASKLGSGDALIAGDDQLLESVKAFDVDIKINPKDIYELKTKYKNECLSSMGIYSVEEKKERKIVAEVTSQNDFTDHIYQDMKTMRMEFVDALNKADPSLNIKLIETYELNIRDDINEEAMREHEIAKAKGELDNVERKPDA